VYPRYSFPIGTESVSGVGELFFKDFFETFSQGWDYLKKVTYDTVSSDFKDGGFGVFIDSDDDLGRLHAYEVLDLA
jgi:hypothetical protein